jgi:hypothetical protein
MMHSVVCFLRPKRFRFLLGWLLLPCVGIG